MNTFRNRTLFAIVVLLLSTGTTAVLAQSAMINVYARNVTYLNGEWEAIIDPSGTGEWRQVWKETKPTKRSDFNEYAFDGGPKLQVPGDFNSQMKELTYMEGTVWYKRSFDYHQTNSKRLFIYFGAVNYRADVYLNGQHLGSHEGGFTPFQFELTDRVVTGTNSLIVKVNNERQADGLPGKGFDWFNYGGITRDVMLVETPVNFIEDYFIQLKNGSMSEVEGWVRINGNLRHEQDITIEIPEIKVRYRTRTNADGLAPVRLSGKFRLWSPEDPKLYQVIVRTTQDNVTDDIGFRSVRVSGGSILLNGKPIFLKGVNIHEERPFGGGRAYSAEDAKTLLGWAREAGCNLVRLAHYPHSEHTVRIAEKMGLMVWDELPVYQHIQFSAPGMHEKLRLSMREMMRRDRNRCAVIFWALSNETYLSTPGRDEALVYLTNECRIEDATRLVTSAANTQHYSKNTMFVQDSLYNGVDVIALNEYLGWYQAWEGTSRDTKWQLPSHKPVIISEFGGEAKYGVTTRHGDDVLPWSEEYQEQIYKDQIAMFANVPNLAGVCAWLLVDYRSPGRMHPVYQNGYNRKGILSEFGEKKKAWFVLKSYYSNIR